MGIEYQNWWQATKSKSQQMIKFKIDFFRIASKGLIWICFRILLIAPSIALLTSCKEYIVRNPNNKVSAAVCCLQTLFSNYFHMWKSKGNRFLELLVKEADKGFGNASPQWYMTFSKSIKSHLCTSYIHDLHGEMGVLNSTSQLLPP